MFDFSGLTEQDFIQRKINNLDFFKRRYRGIYDFFSERDVEGCELIFNIGEPDLNVEINGSLMYPGGAVQVSVLEAENFRKIFSKDVKVANFRLKGSSKPRPGRFSSEVVYKIVKNSPITSRGFDGYVFSDVVPSVLFLGVGLGIHVDLITRDMDIAHAIIYEPDPDLFLLSLFVVDWENIWRRFEKFGKSISFVVSSDKNSNENSLMLENEIKKAIPFHPDFLVFQNHNSNIGLLRDFEKVRQNLPAVLANRDMFDRQIEHFRQELVNIRDGLPVLVPNLDDKKVKPVIIVGSGPSLDERIQSILTVRDKVVLVTAGTSLAPVLSSGMEPDFHVELDSDYVIYEILKKSLQGRDHRISLIAKATVHPAVLSLFSSKSLFYSAETNNHYVWKVPSAFRGASPTCTNAALSIFVNSGFKNIFLAGADFGFASEAHDHSAYSVYGRKNTDDFSSEFQSRSRGGREQLFKVESVFGQEINTRAAYFSAKLKVESLIKWSERMGLDVSFNTISDGAKIDGADWLSVDQFLRCFPSGESSDGCSCGNGYFDNLFYIKNIFIDEQVNNVLCELEGRVQKIENLILKVKVNAAKDLVFLANELRQCSRWLQPEPLKRGGSGRAELMAFQLLLGTTTDLIYLLLAHGLAARKEELPLFYELWKTEALHFFRGVGVIYKEKVIGLAKSELLEDPASFAHGKF
ncbi:uncharacterized protein DUF115 [Marinobacter nauticus]|uniref:Uncharacterized protein DUF115 n=1 Tax=Marinobacter nauticus TaxID=2743 RepID=A0A368XXA0_MARNT|nr:6-hydroxymethylpterin diphosphokinase MptE-like protein [Marinobacter nauticus]RCW71167.1 uncharacterized protein DUF115 [Marinobacter nauticus]